MVRKKMVRNAQWCGKKKLCLALHNTIFRKKSIKNKIKTRVNEKTPSMAHPEWLQFTVMQDQVSVLLRYCGRTFG